jgi:hypothetical protein
MELGNVGTTLWSWQSPGLGCARHLSAVMKLLIVVALTNGRKSQTWMKAGQLAARAAGMQAGQLEWLRPEVDESADLRAHVIGIAILPHVGRRGHALQQQNGERR